VTRVTVTAIVTLIAALSPLDKAAASSPNRGFEVSTGVAGVSWFLK
jgi:hypothetical protein